MSQNISLEAITQALLSFVNANTWSESKDIVEQNKDLLLSDAALEVFADLLEQYEEDADATRLLTQHRDLLQRCRAEGIEAAFAPLLNRPSRPSEGGATVDEGTRQAQALLQEIMQSDNQRAFVEQNLARFTESVQAAFA